MTCRDQKLQTDRATGKTGLTYEEDLVSERRANEKVQQIPKELVAPILHMVQYKEAKGVVAACKSFYDVAEGVAVYSTAASKDGKTHGVLQDS
ncbi:hypothetical protein Taro_050696 [Colocasia esculenta]|uniref:WAC domain-containing protein n=1 Tax=Colocasia esculenta TaxID=4460 RepID=A0A843XER6_COLES|nr:hypothetical protein [Colocasia esculenta]